MAMTLRRLVRLAPLALLFAASTAIGQGTSSITGTVTDASTGKAVVGAVVVLTSPAMPAEQTVVTEAGGKFAVPNLPAGDYTLAVQFEGYKPFERSDLKLKEGTTLRANAQVVPEAVQMEEVVVTGSRIRRKDLTTPAPVTVINREQLTESGASTIAEFLQALPEQSGGLNAQVNNGNNGEATIDLRGLGSNRALVLINGRRLLAASRANESGANVDLNTIPTAAVERVEILKDGGSSVYGSDAIGGVVNIITKRKYDGAEFSMQLGQSSHGDGTLKQFDFVGGTSSERGSMLVAGGYSEQEPVWARDRGRMGTILSRNYNSGRVRASGSSATPAGTFFPDADCKPGSSAACDHLWSIAAGDGSVTPSNDFFTNLRGVDAYGGGPDSYNYQAQNYLYTPLRRWQLWTSGELKLAEPVSAFFEGSFVNRFSRQALAPSPVQSAAFGASVNPISPYSVYNPYGVDLEFRRRMLETSNRIYTQDDNTWRLVGGLKGEIGDWGAFLKGWEWNTSLVYSSNSHTDDTQGAYRVDKLNDAIGPSMIDPATGTPICVRVPGNASTAIAGCVPINFLGGAGTVTKDMTAGLLFDGVDRSYWNMSAVEVNVDGELFKLWAEQPASLALGYQYQRNWGYFLPNTIAGTGDSTDQNYLASTPGGFTQSSIYAELGLPLVSNLPGIELLELTGSFRASHYSNFGGNTTFKLGARYSPVRDLTLRGTVSTAFRAPSVIELHAGNGDNFEQVTDPCAAIDPTAPGAAELTQRCGTAANNGYSSGNQIHALSGGNATLKPETARIYTAGLVYEPRQVEGLSFTADYYLINLDKEIAYIGGAVILDGCYNRGNQAYCNLITRGAHGYITTFLDTLQNAAKVSTGGIDLAARYDMKATAAGRFTLGAAANWLQKYNATDASGFVSRYKNNADGLAPGQSEGGPVWKGAANVVWGLGGWGAGLTGRFIGSYVECGTPDGTGPGLCTDPAHKGVRTISPYYQWDGFVSYGLSWIGGKTSLQLGILNIGNSVAPVIFSETYTNSNASLYDYMGRFYYLRLSHAI